MQKRLTAQGAQGRQSFTVTLPIEWVKEHKLETKKIVELNQAGQNIVISAKKEPTKIKISDTIYKEGLVKILRALYRRGVDEIEFETKDLQTAKKIQEVLNTYLIGFEIVEQRGHAYIIKDITGEDPQGFTPTLRRAFLLLLSLSEEFDEAAFHSLQKLCVYAQRILLKHGHEDFNKTTLYYMILDRLEKISDEYHWLGKEGNPAIKKQLHQLLYESYLVLHKFDGKKYIAAQEESYKLKNKLKNSVHEHSIARLINILLGDIFATVGK